MALIQQTCPACGKETPVDTALPAAEQACMHCGGTGSDRGVSREEWEQKPVRISKERIEELKESGYQPQERSLMNCPRCKAMTPMVEGRPLHKQRCLECGLVLGEKPGRVKKRKKSKSIVDGVQVRRRRERVWMPMLGAGLIMAMAGIFWMWMKTRPAPDSAEVKPSPPPMPRVHIRNLAAKFMAARTPEELLPHIRKPASHEKSVREWCAARPGTLPLGGDLLSITVPRETLGVRLSNATILLKGVTRLNLLTVETPEGWRVEWPAFTGISETTVEEFLKTRPGAPVTVFLHVRRSDYYNHAYSDSSMWQSLRVSDRQEQQPFYAYAARKDAALMTALKILPEGVAPSSGKGASEVTRRMALRVHFSQPAADGAPQVEVASVEGDGWYVP